MRPPALAFGTSRRAPLTIAWTLTICLTGNLLSLSSASAQSPASPPAVAPSDAPPKNASASATPATPAATDWSASKVFPKLRRPSLNHHLQFGLAIMPGTGYRGIFPYKEDVSCGEAGKRVCTSTVPFFIDIQPSFGISPRWDLLVDLRFGVAQDFTQSRQFAVAPGFRYWLDPEFHTKFFATVQVVLDTTAQHSPSIKNNDVAFRNSNGFMYEVMRNFGVYFQFGETIGFRRWLRFEIDVGLGVQARLP